MVIAALESGPLETRDRSSASGGERRHPGGNRKELIVRQFSEMTTKAASAMSRRAFRAKDTALGSAKGMTLPEVLVALGFIAVFSAGMATLAVTLVRSSAKAKAMDTAVFLAHDRLEKIRNTPYGNVTAATFPREAYGTIVVGDQPVAFPDHQRSVTIQDDTPNAGVKRVVVTVSWRDGSVTGEVLVGQ